jgi:hypothetical protein
VDPTHGQGESRHPQVRGPVGDWSAPFISPEAAATIAAATIAAATEAGVTEAAFAVAFAAATAWIVRAGAAISVAGTTAAAISTAIAAIAAIAAAILGQSRDGEEDGRRQHGAGKKEKGEEGAEQHRSGLFWKDKRMSLKIRRSVWSSIPPPVAGREKTGQDDAG